MIQPEEPLFLGCQPWFKVKYLGLAPGFASKSYASVAKGLRLKVRRCCRLIPTFVEVTGEKLAGGLPPLPPYSE